ncbi:site-specific DNA recombinase [Streptococcus pneumoniae]|nr:site-specific DNA recombinase [Streptococcus pneumoniae]
MKKMRGRYILDNDWNGLADLIANLIAKYAGALDLDNLPDPTPAKNQEMKNSFDMAKTQIETD